MSTNKIKKKAPKLSVDEQMKKDLDNAKFLADWGFTGPNPNVCHCCGNQNSTIDGYMIQCAKCKLVYYCSMKCFNVDLESHRQFCDSGKLLSDVERVTLFDLPKASAVEEPVSKTPVKSPKSPKTPRLLGATKSSVGASLSAQKEKPGKKKVSPKKSAKTKVSPKKNPTTSVPSGDDVMGVNEDSKPCTIPIPFSEHCELGELVPSEGSQSPPCDVENEPRPSDESKGPTSPGILTLPSVEEPIPSTAESVVSQAESTLLSALPACGIPSSESVSLEVKEVDTPLEPNEPIEKQSEPISEFEATSRQLEIDAPVAMTEGVTVPPVSDAKASQVASSPPPSREPSFHKSSTAEDNHEPAHAETESKESPHDKRCTSISNDDESSSCGAELSPLRSSRNWSEDDDIDVLECRDPIPNLPSLDLSSSSGNAVSVSSDVAEDEQIEVVNQLPGPSADEDCDGSESTIIEYEDVVIEVQTCRASGSADVRFGDEEDDRSQIECCADDAASCDANHNSSPRVLEHTDELVNGHAEEPMDESDASSSTIIEYEEVIIEEEVYRAAGSMPMDSGLSVGAGPQESQNNSLAEPAEDDATGNHPSLETAGHSSEHPDTAIDSPIAVARELPRPEALPAEISRHSASSSDAPSENQLARSALTPRRNSQGDQGKDSATSDDDSTGSDSTIVEYEEVIIDEDWWGVSGNVNCFDGIVYELSEEVMSRKSGSVSLTGDPGSVQENASSDKVRRFRLVGPNSSGRYFLRPVEGELDAGEPSLESEKEEGNSSERDSTAASFSAASEARSRSNLQGRHRHDGTLEDHSNGSYRKLRIGEGSMVEAQEGFVREVVDLKPVSPLSRRKEDSNDLRERIALRPTPSSPKQVAPERDPSFVSKRSSLKEAPRSPPKSPAEIRDYSFIKKRSNLKETAPPSKKNIRSGGEHYLVFDKDRKAYILRSLTGAKDAAEARDVVVLRPVKPSPKRQFEFEKPEWVKKSPIRNRGSLEGLLGQSFGNLGHSIADLSNGEPPSPCTPSRNEEGDDDQSLGSFQEMEKGDSDRAMDQSGETIYVLEDGTQDPIRRARPWKAESGPRSTAGPNVALRRSPGSPGAKKVESKLPSWAIKSPLKTTERGLMMKSFSDLSKLGNASFSTMASSEQAAFAKPTRKSSAAYKYVSPHRYKADYMNSMATMIEASYEANESGAAECKTLRSMPEL